MSLLTMSDERTLGTERTATASRRIQCIQRLHHLPAARRGIPGQAKALQQTGRARVQYGRRICGYRVPAHHHGDWKFWCENHFSEGGDSTAWKLEEDQIIRYSCLVGLVGQPYEGGDFASRYFASKLIYSIGSEVLGSTGRWDWPKLLQHIAFEREAVDICRDK